MSKRPQPQAQQETTKIRLKLAILLVIVICTAALLAIYLCISRLKDDIRATEQVVQEETEKIEDLEYYKENADTDEGVKEVAKNELGMVDPDTTYYEFN